MQGLASQLMAGAGQEAAGSPARAGSTETEARYQARFEAISPHNLPTASCIETKLA